jgi:CAP12/Pycsar effector protein, TIR domain
MSVESKSTLEKLKEFYVGFEQIVASKTVNRGFKVRWIVQSKNALAELFGQDAPAVKDLISLVDSERKTDVATPDFVEIFRQVGFLIRLLEKSSSASLLRPSSHPSGSPATKEIFIVHGHDELNTRRLGDIMRDSFGLTPIVIRDQAGAGRAILEKFERHADHCAFAFGLFTPDDSIRTAQGEYRQARPNVIFETGLVYRQAGKPSRLPVATGRHRYPF